MKARVYAMGRTLEYNFTTLRISRAFIRLRCRSNGDTKGISLAWIGDCEIRMNAAPPGMVEQQPLFIVDIFDHDAQLLIGSRACHSLADGAVAFETFLLQAEPPAGSPH